MRFIFNNFVLDSEQRVLWKEGEVVPLSPKAFETLELLVLARGRIVTKQEFMKALWPDSFVEDANLTQNIFVLRKILGSGEDGRSYIETFPRRGYRFVGSVREEGAEPDVGAPQPIQETRESTGPESGVLDPTISIALDGALPGAADVHQPLPQPARQRLGIPVTLGLIFVLLILAGGLVLHGKNHLSVAGYKRITNDGRSKDLLNTPSILAVDGDTLYFTEINGQRSVLAKVSAEGGEVSYDAALSANVHVLGLHPSNPKALLLGEDWPFDAIRPLLSKDLSTGAVSEVFGIQAQDANWSPDGTRLAYVEEGNVFVRSSDGKTVPVASVTGIAYWPRWSPDSRILRFSENYQGFHDRLWQVDSGGGNLHELFANQNDSEHMCCGSWTASGHGFVYLSIQTNNSKIHIRSEDQRGSIQWPEQSIDIAAAPLDRWTAPLPAPDGKHVFAIGEQLRGRLVRINPETRRPEAFIGGISAEGVSYSPDHANIIWTAYPEGTLWRSRSDGSGRVQLSQPPLIARFPHWSPDGSSIAFIAARPGSDWQVYTVPASGGEPRLLVDEPRGQGVATWSSDGKALAFGHLLNAAEARNQTFDIEVFHLQDRSSAAIPGSVGLWTARWSPDGRFLSAVTVDNQTLRLYDMQAGTWSDLAHSNVNDVVWSPDSQSIFFDTSRGTDPTLYRVRLSDRKLEAWASLKDFRRAGFFAPWLGMAPDGSPILLEDASIQELYSIAVNLP